MPDLRKKSRMVSTNKLAAWQVTQEAGIQFPEEATFTPFFLYKESLAYYMIRPTFQTRTNVTAMIKQDKNLII